MGLADGAPPEEPSLAKTAGAASKFAAAAALSGGANVAQDFVRAARETRDRVWRPRRGGGPGSDLALLTT